MLTHASWIVTCWHLTRTVTGAVRPFFAAPSLRQPFLQRVLHLRSSEDTTGSDLGLCLAHALIDTYGATHRLMQEWAADWEVDFFNDLAEGSFGRLKGAEARLDAMLATAAEAHRRISGLQHARAESRTGPGSCHPRPQTTELGARIRIHVRSNSQRNSTPTKQPSRARPTLSARTWTR